MSSITNASTSIRILFFRQPFNRSFSIYDRFRLGEVANELPAPFELVYSTQPELLPTAQVVIFDVPFAIRNIAQGKIPKYEGQMWVGWCLECEENYPWLKEQVVKELFDVWMTYHPDADVVLPYYDADYAQRLLVSPEKKSADVCMFVSNPANHSQRKEYLLELVKYLPIDSYGKWLRNKVLPDDNGYRSKLEVMKHYRFTIAFENAIGTDYVTEKFYEPLLSGSVPIYLGAPNIDKYTPDSSAFIDVRKYPDPKDLAKVIQDYCQNERKYVRLFDWKKRPMNPEFVHLLKEQERHPFLRLIDLFEYN